MLSNKKITVEHIGKLFKDAVKNAIEENRKMNIPSVFSCGGKKIYEMPNGDIKTEVEFKKIANLTKNLFKNSSKSSLYNTKDK